VSVLPALAQHSDGSEAALARFVGWFDRGGALRVQVLLEGKCHAISGSMSSDGFHGRWHETITTEGDERQTEAVERAAAAAEAE
jgi:hypothetical protein